MTRYIGVSLIEKAEPMAMNEYPGYIKYTSNGHTQWDSAAIFEKEYMALNGEDNAITQKDVDAMIKQIHVDEVEPNDFGSKVTIVTATLANGFTITESSTCVDPKNYDTEEGLMSCMERIEDKVWTLLAFLLSCAVNGFQKGGGK